MTITTKDTKNISTFSLKIMIDENPGNPFEDWDCEAPLFTEGGRNFGNNSYNFELENPIRAILQNISYVKLARNYKKIINEIDGIDEDSFLYSGMTKGEWLYDQLYSADITCDHIETVAQIAKLSYRKWASRGYSQGDYLDCITVLTPEYISLIGSKPKSYEDIHTSTQKLWDAYAWGNVYGYQLTEHKPLYTADGTLATETQDEIIDSCWGFYGVEGLEEIKQALPKEHKHLFNYDSIEY